MCGDFCIDKLNYDIDRFLGLGFRVGLRVFGSVETARTPKAPGAQVTVRLPGGALMWSTPRTGAPHSQKGPQKIKKRSGKV